MGKIVDKLKVEKARVNRRLRELSSLRMNSDALYKELEAQGRAKAKPANTMWSVYNKLSLDLMKNNNHGKLSLLYACMARFLLSEGRDPKLMIEESKRSQLYSLAHAWGRPGGKVQILSASDACESCKKLSRTIISIEKALEKMLIPRQCTNDICRCSYRISI